MAFPVNYKLPRQLQTVKTVAYCQDSCILHMYFCSHPTSWNFDLTWLNRRHHDHDFIFQPKGPDKNTSLNLALPYHHPSPPSHETIKGGSCTPAACQSIPPSPGGKAWRAWPPPGSWWRSVSSGGSSPRVRWERWGRGAYGENTWAQ